MEKRAFFYRNSFLKPLFIFVLSFLAYLLYFLEAYPGYYSGDVGAYLRSYNLYGSLDNWVSYFHNAYVLTFYLITKNLAALGLFQIILVSALNTYCWIVLARFSKAKIAWVVTLLMIFSPLNGCMAIWYHRSSLFGWLVFLNLVLLYKFSKVRRFERLERIIFLINLLFVSFLRIDGILISLVSLIAYILKAKEQKRIKIGIFASFILILVVYNLVPKYSSSVTENRPTYKTFLFLYQVRRIHQSIGMEFTDKDMKVLKTIVPDESHRKLWLEGKGWFDPQLLNGGLTQDELNDFAKWSVLFISKNPSAYIKTQAKTLFDSFLLGSPNTFYFIRSDARHRPYIEFPGKIVEFIIRYSYTDLKNPKAIFVALMFGASIPFVFIFVCFVIAFKRNRNVLIPLIPLLPYSIFMFFFQPLSKSFYWYYLAYSSYFIVLVLGYEIFSTKKPILIKKQDFVK